MKLLKDKESEAKIQAAWIKLLKEDGYIVTRLRAVSEAGWPDIMLLKKGVARFIEFKQVSGTLSTLQRLKINQLRREGFQVFIISYMPIKKMSAEELIRALAVLK